MIDSFSWRFNLYPVSYLETIACKKQTIPFLCYLCRCKRENDYIHQGLIKQNTNYQTINALATKEGKSVPGRGLAL